MKIKNNTTGELTVYSEILSVGEEYTINSNLDKWQSDRDVLMQILSKDILVFDGTQYFTNEIEAHSYFIEKDSIVKVQETTAFASKILPSGEKLYRRKHGYSDTIPAGQSKEVLIEVPYFKCKINEVEIVRAGKGDTVDFKIYDTPEGTFSTVPNYLLNQFGFAVQVIENIYKDKSDYDAEVYQGMKIGITYTNNGEDAINIGYNVVFHEVK